MQQTHHIHIPVPRDVVWAALMDPLVLRRCIPHCERLEPRADDPDTLDAEVVIALGPLKARFAGVLAFSEKDPPERYVFHGEGRGGAAGLARGWAEGRLVDLGAEGTRIDYHGHAALEGRIARFGGGLVDRFADTLLARFFHRLAAILTGGCLEAADRAVEAGTANAPRATSDEAASADGPAVSLARHLPRWLGGDRKDKGKDKGKDRDRE